MPLDVGLVGLPGSGKTTLFRALTGAPTPAGEYGKPHVGMASVPDERLARLAEVLHSAKSTPAAMRVVDPPGLDASVLGELRKVDALIAVSRSFGPDVDAGRDSESLALELILADRDHVEKRLERVRQQAKSGDPETRKEVESLERVLAHVEAGGSLADYADELPGELEPLTTKPLVRIVNGQGGLDLQMEGELSELSPDEAAAFREGQSALEATVATLFEEAGLLTFFTGSDKEARAWTLRRGPVRARGGRDDPHGHRARLHSLRGDLVRAPDRERQSRRGCPPRAAAPGG